MKVFSEKKFRKLNPHVAQSAIIDFIGKTPEQISEMGFGYRDDWFEDYRQSQKQIVIEMLKNGDEVSNRSCSKIGILRIAEIIRHVERTGLKVEHKKIKHPTDGRRSWVEYGLIK